MVDNEHLKCTATLPQYIQPLKVQSHRQIFPSFCFLNFMKIHIIGFPFYSTREDLPIYVSITNVGLILTNLRWFQLVSSLSTSPNYISNFFEILGFPYCSTREDLSIDVSNTNVGLILTKLCWFLFSEYGQTDGYGFGILTWQHVGTQKIWTRSSKLVVSRLSTLYASPEDGDA